MLLVGEKILQAFLQYIKFLSTKFFDTSGLIWQIIKEFMVSHDFNSFFKKRVGVLIRKGHLVRNIWTNWVETFDD